MPNKPRPIRALVIDDSPTARQLLLALFEDTTDILVVGTGANGEEAIRQTLRLHPDVVVMDIQMPLMDGMEATRRIMRECPTPIVLITASLMRRDADLTFKALQAGALTVVRKPGLADQDTVDKLLQAVRLMADVPVVHHWGRRESTPAVTPIQAGASTGESPLPDKLTRKIKILGIASSTGGPGVLALILGGLPEDFPIPILVVQHVTNGFASGLAEWLNTQTPLKVSLAGHGERPQPGTILIAPDDYHLQVNSQGVAELYKGQPHKGLRPSANFLFRSLAKAYGALAAGVILTGMGDDGAEGLEALHQAGGLVLAQDEESCVVYGMPREAVVRNAVDAVLPPEQIALAIKQIGSHAKEGRADV